MTKLTDNPFSYLEKPPVESDLLAKYNWVTSQQGTRNSVITKLKDYYNGEGLVTALENEGIRLVVNDVKRIVDSYVDFLSGAFDIQVPPPYESSQGKTQADKIERLLYSQWQRNYQRVKQQEMAHNITLCGGCPIYTHPVSKRLTNRGVYVSINITRPENFYGVPIANDRFSYSEVFSIEKRLNINIKEIYGYCPNGASYEESDVVFYWNPYWFLIMVDGKIVSNNIVKPIKHDWGFVPWVYIPSKVYPGEIYSDGEANSMVAFNKYLNELLSDAADMIDEYAHPTIVGSGTGRTRADWQRGAFNEIKAGGTVKYLEWGGNALNEINGMVSSVRALSDDSAANPKMSNMEGARGAKQLMMGMMPFDVRLTARKAIMCDALSVVNEHILMLIEKLYPNEEITLRGTKRGESFYMQFPVNSIKGFYDNAIIYKPGPIDYQQRIIATLQLVGAKLMSKYTAREELGIQSPVEEDMRIQEEAKADLDFQTKMQASMQAAQAKAQPASPEQLAAGEKGAIETPTPTRVGPGRPVIGPGGVEQPGGTAPPGEGPQAGDAKSRAQQLIQKFLAQRRGAPTEGTPKPKFEMAPEETPIKPATVQEGKIISLEGVISAIKNITKIKGRVFLTGDIVTNKETSGPIELSLTSALDKATIVNGVPQFKGRLTFTVLKGQEVPDGNFIEITFETSGTNLKAGAGPSL